MNDRVTRENRPGLWPLSLPNKLVVSFGLLCAIFVAIGGVFFVSMRAIENLNGAERSFESAIVIPARLGKNVAFQQTEVFQHLATTDPQEKERLEQVIARLAAMNAKDLKAYEKTLNSKGETQLYAEALQAAKAYSDATGQLLELSRAQRNAEMAAFARTTQVPAHNQYQASLEELLRAEEAEGTEIGAATTRRITLTRITTDVLSGLAIFIALATGAAVSRMVHTLRRDKERLKTEVEQHEHAEQALRDGEARYRLLVDHSPDAIFVVCDERIVFANPATLKLLGADEPMQVLGRNLSQVVHPDERAEVDHRARELAAGRRPKAAQRRLLRLDGATIEVETRIISFLYQGKPAVQVVAQENTERKEAEQALAESERRFRFLNELGDATRFVSQPKEIMTAAAQLLGRHLHASRCAYAEVEKDGNHFQVSADYTSGCACIVGEFRLSDFGEQTHSQLAAGRTVVLCDVPAELTGADGGDAYEALEIKAMIACPLIKKGHLVAAMAVHHMTPRRWTNAEIALVQEVVERCWSIIERARAQLILRESEEHLRLVIAASNDGIWEHDLLTGVLIWSDRMYEMFGLDRQSFVPTADSFLALIHPEDRARFEKAVSEQMAIGGRYETPIRINRSGHGYGNFLARERGVLDATGTPVRIIGSLADLTGLLQAEEKLIQQADLLNLAHDAIMVRDMDDRIEFWNQGAQALYGWTTEEACGRRSADFMDIEVPAKTAEAQRILLETGVWSGECNHLTKNGDNITVRSRWTLVRDEQGLPKCKLIINTDMTEQKKIEEQFLRAQRLESIGTLASGVAHDLNNILVPIMMAAPLLHGETSEAERENFIGIIETSAQRGAEIIKQVLTFARGADGDRILLQPIYLLEEVSKIASQTFPKSITVRTSYQEDVRLLEADSTQLHQVLLNLCINARDAMPNGGELCLGAVNFDADKDYASRTPGAAVGPYVILEVTDGGTGIPNAVLDKIYDPFFTTKEIGRGTGLGLSTVAGIVKSHGGFVDVSTRPGRTSFKVFLPAKATHDTSNDLAEDTMIPRGRGETILVVDDEPAIREVAEIILKSHGYKVIVAEGGSSALAVFARQMGLIDVVVTDLSMPGMDGVLLVRTLRQIDPKIKVIVSTGQADDAHAAEIAALRVDSVLTKPYTKRNLLLKLSHVLHRGLLEAA